MLVMLQSTTSQIRPVIISQINSIRLLGTDLIDSSEALDQAGPGFLVETLGVPQFALLQGSVHKDLDEGQRRFQVLVNFPKNKRLSSWKTTTV